MNAVLLPASAGRVGTPRCFQGSLFTPAGYLCVLSLCAPCVCCMCALCVSVACDGPCVWNLERALLLMYLYERIHYGYY